MDKLITLTNMTSLSIKMGKILKTLKSLINKFFIQHIIEKINRIGNL